MSSLLVTGWGCTSPTQSGSSMLVPAVKTESKVELGQLGSQLGGVVDDPMSLCTTASPVKLASFETATCPAVNFDSQSDPESTLVFESISNGVTPSAASVNEGVNVTTTGIVSAAAISRRRRLDTTGSRFICS